MAPLRPTAATGRVRLKGKLYRVVTINWVDIPKRALAKVEFPPALDKGKARGWQARLHFNDDFDRVTLLPGKPGCYKLAFKVELLRAAGAKTGDMIEFALEPDHASREPETPAELTRGFQARPELHERWMAHSVAMRRQIVRYILQAKSPEVQAKRCWIFLDRLAETGKLSAG